MTMSENMLIGCEKSGVVRDAFIKAGFAAVCDLLPTESPGPHIVGDIVDVLRSRWANQTNSGQNQLPPSATRSADRAKTYQGIADAMVNQWADAVR